MQYTQDYDNSLHFSPHFQEFARSVAVRLIERHNLYDKNIIEIGCGSGDFLRLLCEIGGNRGVGFDPSSAPNKFLNSDNNRITFIQDFYSEQYISYEADFICCRHVLEHIQHPLEFLISLRRAIGRRTGTIVFFEVPNSLFTLRDLGIWDLIYEHCSYFCSTSLTRVFTSSGLKVVNLTEAFEGQFLHIETSPVDRRKIAKTPPPLDNLGRITDHVAAFSKRFLDKLEVWCEKIEKMAHEGKRVLVWGAGSKGVTFLNSLKTRDQVEYVIDINPKKQGKYIAGTGQRIMPPEFLKEYRPDIVIVMNPIYLEEIRNFIRTMNLNSDLVSA